MKGLYFAILIVFSFKLSVAQQADETAIRSILNIQETAWNEGNIDDFMKGYWHNDSLMFIGKSGITYGWEKTLNRYKKTYPDTASMGKLSFTLLGFKTLSPVYYFVVGKWHLERSVGNLEGHFTLLFRKIEGHWFIIADHTS